MKQLVVTCGGTTEAIDDVRAITNFSTGRFGHALAAELAKYKSFCGRRVLPSFNC